MKLTKQDIKRMINYDRFTYDFENSFYMTYNYLGEPFLTKYCHLYLNLCESDQCLDENLKSTFYKKIKLPLINNIYLLRMHLE